MTNILVTGGAGFIGSHLVDELLKAHHTVVVLDDFSSGRRSNLLEESDKLKIIRGSILDLGQLSEQAGRIDTIVHLAALISGYDSLIKPDEYFQVNVLGTQRVIEAAPAMGAKRIVFASSSTVYGNRGDAPIDEVAPPAPLTVYALTKLACEHLLRLHAPLRNYSHCSLRFFNVYGPRQAIDHPYANVTCKFSHAAAKGLGIKRYGDGEQSRDFVFVEDAVRAVAAVLGDTAHSVYNVGTGRAESINAMIGYLERLVGNTLPTEQLPRWPNDIRQIRADTSRIEADLGWQPQVSLQEGLHRTVDFFRAD